MPPVLAFLFGAGEMDSLTLEAVSVTVVPAVADDGLAATDPTDGVPAT